MLRTITMGSTVSIQGIFVRTLDDGRIEVRVDDKNFTGRPVSKPA